MIQFPQTRQIQAILKNYTTIAVVGLSPREERPSHQVARYLLSAGYTIIPVNPGQAEILDRVSYPDLLSIPGEVEIVDIFRRSDQVMPIVQDAIIKKAKVVWMQQGIMNEAAAKLAEEKGIMVVMDRCIKDDHRQFFPRSGRM